METRRHPQEAPPNTTRESPRKFSHNGQVPKRKALKDPSDKRTHKGQEPPGEQKYNAPLPPSSSDGNGEDKRLGRSHLHNNNKWSNYKKAPEKDALQNDAREDAPGWETVFKMLPNFRNGIMMHKEGGTFGTITQFLIAYGQI